jgi:hypothetical protein
MSVNGLAGIPEVCNAFLSEGRKAPGNMFALTDTGGAGLVSIRGEKNCITTLVGNLGQGLFISSPSKSGLGNGKRPPDNERSTKHFASGTADISSSSFVKLSNTDGSMISFDGGGGRKSTILIATGDGQNGMLITDGFVALYSKGTELIVHGNAAKITSTYHLIQETNKGGGQTLVQTYGYHSA